MVTINMPVKQKQTCASSLPWPVQWKCWIAQYQGLWRQWHVWDRRLPEVSTPRWQLEQSSWPTSTSKYIICKHQTRLFYEGQVYSSCAQSCCWFQSCYKRKFLPLRCPDTVGWATGRECRVGMLVVLIRQRVLHILVSSSSADSTLQLPPPPSLALQNGLTLWCRLIRMSWKVAVIKGVGVIRWNYISLL